MKLYIKPHNDSAREFYRNHGYFHDGDAGLDLYVLEDLHFEPGETKAIKLTTIRCAGCRASIACFGSRMLFASQSA